MSLEPPPPPSIYGTVLDPTDTALSPWLWLPLLFVFVACLTFVSIRRAQAFELFARLQEYLDSRFPLLSRLFHLSPASSTPRRGIHLTSQDLTTNSIPDTDSEGSDGGDDDDELPSLPPSSTSTSSSLPPYRPTSRSPLTKLGEVVPVLADAAHAAWTTLGWDRGFAGGAAVFGGTRKQDRIGGIRLGSSSFDDGDVEAGRPAKRGARGKHSARSDSVGSTGTLFEIGDGEDEGAVELPTEFGVKSVLAEDQGQELRDWKR